MAVVTRRLIEKRRRGPVGWFFLLLFWAVNGLFLFAFLATLGESGQRINAQPTNARDAYAAGTVIGYGLYFFLWAPIALVTGILTFMTRGRKEMVEIQER